MYIGRENLLSTYIKLIHIFTLYGSKDLFSKQEKQKQIDQTYKYSFKVKGIFKCISFCMKGDSF